MLLSQLTELSMNPFHRPNPAEQNEVNREKTLETEARRETEVFWPDDEPGCPPSEILEKATYRPDAMQEVLRGYGASPQILSTWARLFDGFDFAGWIIKTSNAICYTPQMATRVRPLVFVGTPARDFTDGFFFRVATGTFQLRGLNPTLNYLRRAFNSKRIDCWRTDTQPRTFRGPGTEDLCRQLNTRYGTHLHSREDLSAFLQTVKKLGWDLELVGGASLQLEEVRLNGSGPTTITSREPLEHVSAEAGEDAPEPGLSPGDTAPGKRTQSDFEAHYEDGVRAEKRQAFWDGKDHVSETAIRGVFYSLLGTRASANTSAAASGARFQRWLGEVILWGEHDLALANILGISSREIRELRREAQIEWKNDWK